MNYFKLANLFNLCRQTVSKNKRNEYLSKLPKYSEIILHIWRNKRKIW
ncbi:hypothetical protein NW064_02850 [Mycoplasmopsis felis]|nr:hypothetical protein [Mycoplasmopsis felis]UWW01299.1 hypothetical protein NW064_02850 [Mycoplasmopsis felis]